MSLIEYILISTLSHNRNFQSYIKLGRRCTSRQLSELPTVAFRGGYKTPERHYVSCQLLQSITIVIKLFKTRRTLGFPSTIGINNCSFQSNVKPWWNSTSSQLSKLTIVALSYLTNSPEGCYASRQMSKLTTLDFTNLLNMEDTILSINYRPG